MYGRLLSGLEALRTQQIYYDDFVDEGEDPEALLAGFSSDDLTDLAGNAFDGLTCAAVVIAALVAMSVVLFGGASGEGSDDSEGVPGTGAAVPGTGVAATVTSVDVPGTGVVATVTPRLWDMPNSDDDA